VASDLERFCEDMKYALGRQASEKHPVLARRIAADDRSECPDDGLQLRRRETSRVMHPRVIGSDARKSGRVVELPPIESELHDVDQSIEGRAMSLQHLVFDRLSTLHHGKLLTTI
jgi:hypothetical protein